LNTGLYKETDDKKVIQTKVRFLNISVLGCGRWGTFIAWYANKVGHNVMLWGRENTNNYIELDETRKNDYLKLPEDIELSNSLHKNSHIVDRVLYSTIGGDCSTV
jgi:glycerol-3-phosphate dehydrogenase (NAD(P)+)